MISIGKGWERRSPRFPSTSVVGHVEVEEKQGQSIRSKKVDGPRWLRSPLMMVACVVSVLMPMTAHATTEASLNHGENHGEAPLNHTPTLWDETPGMDPHSCTMPLTTAIAPIIDQPTFDGAQWGIGITSVETGEWLYQHNTDHYFIPASNMKLLTTAAALVSLDSLTADLLALFYDWVGVTNRDSNNHYAEALLRRLGGSDTLKSTLEPLGVNPYHYRQVDGSGLSRYNMAKPTVFIEVLLAMTNSPHERVFSQSLPVAGHSGTLRNRFKETAAQGIVRAKTGTLRGVRALSGYVDHPNEGPLVFSIIVNQPGQSGRVMVDAIDQVVLAIAQTQNCALPDPLSDQP
ncbi:MAG: D-alanyl-D-alanine carboxypeptidase [Leptolyngbyaceae cyanobacterium]